MPRQRKAQTAPKPTESDVTLVPKRAEPEIVPEGDYAGMTYDEVMAAHIEAVHESLGELSILGAMATLDAVLGEALYMVEVYEGKVAAKDAGINICRTALPYAMLDVSDEPDRHRTLAEARREISKPKRGDDHG